jgi:hypothetical protein
VPTPVITAALYARFYSRGNGDYTNRVLAALRNQFGGHASSGTRAADRGRRRARSGEPAVEGLERLPVPGHDARHLRRDCDLAHRKLLPRALQTSPMRRAAERFKLVRRLAREQSATTSALRARVDRSSRAARPTRRCSTAARPDAYIGILRRPALPSSGALDELDEEPPAAQPRLYLSTAPEFFP